MQEESMIKKSIILILTAVFSFCVFAETPLPQEFRGIKLGMTVDQVKELLLKDNAFGYKGDRDVSLLPDQQRILIETDTSDIAPFSFLSRCYFQFYEDKLYSMILYIKPDMLDYYSVFSALCEKYGNPDELNPTIAEWKNQNVILSLEKPLTLKYVDNVAFEKMLGNSKLDDDVKTESIKEFLEKL